MACANASTTLALLAAHLCALQVCSETSRPGPGPICCGRACWYSLHEAGDQGAQVLLGGRCWRSTSATISRSVSM